MGFIISNRYTWRENEGYIQWLYFWLAYSVILYILTMADPKSWIILAISIFLVNLISGGSLLWILTKKGEQRAIFHYRVIWLLSLVYFCATIIIFWLIPLYL
jgi:hypothetical protein